MPNPTPQSQHKSGDQVVITKLMFKLMSIREPNYKIAAAASIHPSTLSQYASGQKPIAARHLISLCELFQCEADDLIGNITVEIE